MTRQFSLVMALLAGIVLAGTAFAQDAEVPAVDVTDLVADILGDDPQAQREATKQLLTRGKPAVEALAEAAKVEDAEVVTRCFDVLGRLLVSDDRETADAAQAAVEELSKSELDLVGRRARTTLRLKELLRQREALLRAGPAGAAPPQVQAVTATEGGKSIRLKRAADGSFSGTVTETVDGKTEETPIEAKSEQELQEKFPEAHRALQKQKAQAARPAAGIQINGQMLGGGVSTRVSIVNGVRHVEYQAGEEKIEIDDTNGKKIELKHTRPVDGMSKTDVYKADDFDDLKKNHPEAAKLYEKAGGKPGALGGGVIEFRVGPAVPGVPGVPGAPGGPALRLVPAVPGGLESTPSATAAPRVIRSEMNGRTIEIRDEDGRRIRVKLTKDVDGKPVSQEFSADDLPTLKGEHPEAAQLYEQLTGRRAK